MWIHFWLKKYHFYIIVSKPLLHSNYDIETLNSFVLNVEKFWKIGPYISGSETFTYIHLYFRNLYSLIFQKLSLIFTYISLIFTDITWKSRKQADSWVLPLGILIQQGWFRAWHSAFLTSSQVILTNDRWSTLCSWWADKYSNGACVRWLVSNFCSTAIFEEILVTVYTRTHRKKINELWLSL